MGRKLRNHALPEDGTELREESHNRQHVGKWYPRKAASGARVSGFWDAVFQLSLLLLSA